MRPTVGLNKKLLKFSQKYQVWPSWLPRSSFEVDFFNFQAKFQKILGEVGKNTALYFEFSVSPGLKGGGKASRFPSRQVQNSLLLTSCKLSGRPYMACYPRFFLQHVVVLFSIVDILGDFSWLFVD